MTLKSRFMKVVGLEASLLDGSNEASSQRELGAFITNYAINHVEILQERRVKEIKSRLEVITQEKKALEIEAGALYGELHELEPYSGPTRWTMQAD